QPYASSKLRIFSRVSRSAVTQAVHEDVAAGDPGIAVRGVARLVFGWPGADQLVESGAERAEAGEADQVADLGDGQVRRAQQVLSSLDPPVAEILRRSLTVRGGEATQKVVLRHASFGREDLEIEWFRVVAVHHIQGVSQMRYQLDRHAGARWRVGLHHRVLIVRRLADARHRPGPRPRFPTEAGSCDALLHASGGATERAPASGTGCPRHDRRGARREFLGTAGAALRLRSAAEQVSDGLQHNLWMAEMHRHVPRLDQADLAARD